ncbi:MAG: DinB family protein [Bacteroidetes bacterium]|nr:DinB family protein [Bacteroidota bacterium]
MEILKAVPTIFELLEDALCQLTDEQYAQKIDLLSDASIGQHVRHIVEMFVCMQNGYLSGTVNYENRKRDFVIEHDKAAAIALMSDICANLYDDNKEILLEAGFDEHSHALNKIPSNYFREIAYNLEHAIHHMALIKIGIHEVANVTLPKSFGVASSTLKYWKQNPINSNVYAATDTGK